MMFADRRAAGGALAVELAALALPDPLVLALPRGGVPVAAEVARVLEAPLDVMIVRKVGAPGNPELALAALVDGTPADVVLNRAAIEACGLEEDEIAVLVQRERPELERSRKAFRGNRRAQSATGKSVIVVDDGAATGTTMKVVLRALRRRSPRELVAALPVAPPDTVAELAWEADRVVCLDSPGDFRAVGAHYGDFAQLTDGEVTAALHEAAERRRAARARLFGPATG